MFAYKDVTVRSLDYLNRCIVSYVYLTSLCYFDNKLKKLFSANIYWFKIKIEH